jgi:hypothetical protein
MSDQEQKPTTLEDIHAMLGYASTDVTSAYVERMAEHKTNTIGE